MSFSMNRRKWTNLFRSSSRKQRRAGAKPGLQMLHLEDRVTPATFYVATSGDDATGLGSIASPYRTVQKAMTAADLTGVGPHTINVAAGTYATANVDKGFSIGNSAVLTPNLDNLVIDAGWDSTFTTQTFGSSVYVPQTTANGSLTPSAFDPDIAVFSPGVTIRGFTLVFDGTPGAGGTKVSGGLHSLTNDTFITKNTIEVGFSNTNPRSVGVVVHTTPGLYPSPAGVKVMDNTIIADSGNTKGSTAIFINPDAVGRTTPIIISGNTITGTNLGTGVAIDRLSFVTVDGNTISRTGTTNDPLIDLRQATSGTGPYGAPQSGIIISNNTLDGNSTLSAGIELSARNAPTQQVTGVTITGNFVQNVAVGIINDDPMVQGSGVTVTGNSFTGISSKALNVTGTTGTINASNNYFGSNVLATVSGLISGPVDYTPYLNLGTDMNIAAVGFQGDFSDLTVHTAGAQTGSTERIQEGINSIADGSLTGAARKLNVLAGSYAGGNLIDRTLTITGTGSPTVTSNDLNGQDVGFQYAADNGILQGFNIVGDGIGTEYGVLLSDKNSGPGYSGATIQNNSFNNLEYGIATADGAFDYSNATIQNNVITIGTGTWGIYLTAGGGGHQVYGNNISGGAGTAGILVQFIDNVTIGGTGAGQGNTFAGTFGSLLVADANNVSFIGNTITGTLGDRGAVRVEGNVHDLTVNQNSITSGVNPAIRVRQNFSLTPNSNITANNNFLTGNQYAIQVDADGLGTTLDARFNDMSGNTDGSILNSDLDSIVDASGSYFGSSALATVSAGITGSVDYTPYLNLGTDTSAAVGFQGDFSDLTVHTAGAQTSGGRISEGYSSLTATGTIHVLTGTYTDVVDLTPLGDKAVTLAAGASPGQVTVNGNYTLSNNDTLPIEIGGLNAATDNDNFLVTGAVTLGGATLSLAQFNSFTVDNNVLQTFTIVDNDGVDPVSGTFAGQAEGSKISYAGGYVYITYVGGDGNDVVLSSQPLVIGTPGADLVVLTPTATGYDYTVNKGPTVSVADANNPFNFNGNAGDDTLIVNLNGNQAPAIAYNGGTQDTPASAGINTVFGDVLVVNDNDGTHTATYLSAATLPVNGFAGTVAIAGEATITFTGLEPVDMIGLAVANVNFANGDDVITLANGKDSANNTDDAIVVSGTSGGVGFEQVHLRNNAQVNIHTVTGGSDGNDAVTVASANNTHGNVNLSINTGAGTDSVTVTGNATFTGAVALNTKSFAFNGGTLTAGTTATLTGTAGSSVTTNGAGLDLVAPTQAINVSGGIGSGANRLEINATTLTFNTAGAGDAFITDTASGLQVNNSTVGAANTIDLLVLGGNLTSVVDGTRDLGAQTIVLNVPNGTIGTGTGARLEINNSVAGGQLTATTGGGDIFLRQIDAGNNILSVANVNAGTGSVDILVNDGSLRSAAGDAGTADIVGKNVTLQLGTAGRNFGVSAASRLELDATLLQLLTTGSNNNAFVVDTTGGLQVTNSTMGTGVTTFDLLVQNGNLTSVLDGTGDVRAETVILETTGTGTIGTSAAAPLEVNANNLLNATTANADAFILDVSADLPLGLVNVGTGNAYLEAKAGSIVDVNAAANNVTATGVAFKAAASVGAGNAIETTVDNAAASAGTGSVNIANSLTLDLTTVAGVMGVTAGTTVAVSTPADLAVSQPVSAVTTTALTFGADNAGHTATVNAAINGTTATVTGGTGADSITVNTSGSAALSLDGGEAADTYTVNVGTLVGAVSEADTGTMGIDTLNVNGTAAVNTFEVNTATGGDSKVVVDGSQTVNYTAALEVLNLDGADDSDTYNVFFTQGVGASLLPAAVNLADTGAMGTTDLANVSGTDNADTIDVNFTAAQTTTALGSSIAYTNGNLETLNVFSKAANDLVFAKAVNLAKGGPVVNLDGGSPSNPTPLPGDILVIDVTGMVGLNTAGITTPAGSATSTSHNNITWVDFETIPTPIGLGGTFDFGTTVSPVQAGPYVVPPPGSYWVGVANTDTYASKGYYGWATAVNGYDRGNASPNPMQTTFQKVLRDGNWFGPLNVSRTFSVATVASGDFQVSVTIGDTAVVMDQIFVTIEGLASPIAVPTVFQNQFITVTGIGKDANSDGKIDIAFVDKGGTHSYWHVNALDVRPVGLVSPVTITRADGMATSLVADGLTKTTYFADGFFPNAIVTVGATGGKITSADVDPFLVGVQVQADGAGKATFELQHPTGNAPVTLTANAAVVVDAKGTFTQPFTLTPTQKIDFGGPTTPVEAGYLGVTNALYTGSASNGLGWLNPVSIGDRGPSVSGSTPLFRDFVFNLQGAANKGDFNIDVPTGDPQFVTVYLGDLVTARERMQIEVFDGTTFSVAATEIASSKVNSLTIPVTPYSIGGGNFQMRLRFSDLGGTQNGWSVQGLEYRTAQAALAATPTTPVMGNGTALTNYTVSGGAVNGLVTVSSKFGAIQGTDASTLYDGFQIQLDGSGNGAFAIKSPVVASGSLASAVGLVSVTGSHAGGFTQMYTGTKVSYDFGTPTSPVSGGFSYLPGSTIATAQNGVGFKAVAGEYDRNPTSYPNVSKTMDPNLFRDAAWGLGSGTFRVLVAAGATNVPVRVYSYDAYSGRGPITVTAEGGTPANTQTLTPTLTTPAVYNVVGSDTNNDGFLDITVAGSAVWMMNGIEVG